VHPVEKQSAGEAEAEGGGPSELKGVPQMVRLKRRGQEKQQREGVPLKEVPKRGR